MLSQATSHWFGVADAWAENAWTWWIPYLGLYVLGWALRGVVLPVRGGWLCAVGALAMLGVVVAGWRHPHLPQWWQQLFGASYYAFGTVAAAVLIYLAAQSLLRPGRTTGLSWLTRGRPQRMAGVISDSTLGIFGLHFAILYALTRWTPLGPAAVPTPLLVLRFLLGAGLSILLVVLGRRIPVVRAVL